MIGFLRGVLIQKNPQELLLDVSGVGYRVLVPVSTFCRLGGRVPEIGQGGEQVGPLRGRGDRLGGGGLKR